MTAVLARLNPAVPLRYTVHHTNNHQTLTALASICHQLNVYEQEIKNPPPGFANERSTWMTTKRRLNGARRSEGSHESRSGKSTSQDRFYGMTRIHNTILSSSSGLNSPKPMVAEWEAAVTKCAEWTPHLHYSTSSRRRSSHRATPHGKPWTIVVISTIGTFYQLCNRAEADSLKYWGPGIFHRNISDEAPRLRTSGTPICKFRKANGTLLNMDSHDYNMHMASCILSPEPQYKWMLTATPLINVNEDLH